MYINSVTVLWESIFSIYRFLLLFPNFVLFFVTGGMGLGFVYSASIVIVGYYFEKYRAIASGVAMCGSATGTIIMTPVFQHLSEQYGHIRAFQLQAGMVFFCVFISLCYRPLKYTKVTVAEDKTVKGYTIWLLLYL